MATETNSEGEGKRDDKTGDEDKGTETDKAKGTETEEPGDDVEKWKALARKHEKNAGKLQAEVDRIKASTQTEQEKAIDTAKAEARAEARAELLGEMVETALETIAGDKLADPSFVRLLDATTREGFITKEGKVDRKAIGEALDALVKKHPNLAKAGGRAAPLKGGAGDNGKSSGYSMNDEIRRLAGRH